MATAASMTGAARVTMQGSCLPLMTSGSTLRSTRFRVICSLEIDAVGLMAARTMMGMPLVMPPKIPPLLLVSVLTVSPSRYMRSLASEPRMAAIEKPAPNSTPFTAGTENSMEEIRPSAGLSMGEPRPVGTPVTAHSMMPPTESQDILACSICASIASCARGLMTG